MKTEKSKYEIQADEFLSKTLTVFNAKYLGFQKHFKTDKESRNVWEIELVRNGKVYTFNFGQSIANSTKVSRFGQKILVKPSPYDVLACLTKYDVGTHENFCSEFGYETDSRSGLDTYLAVQNEWSNVNRLFHDVLDELREIN